MRLGQPGDPCVVWACGPSFGRVWEAASISGKPDRRWQWLTINQGLGAGIRRGHYLEIMRGGERIAVAEVDRAEEKFSTAWILDGTMMPGDDPMLGDEARMIA